MFLLVTAGQTREYFDSVRFISNASTGKMGYAIAAEALRRGHEVILISGPVDLPQPPGARVVRVVSAAEMFEVATAYFPECEAAVMAAAVCDYRPSQRLDHKLKKKQCPRTVELEPNADICAHLGKIKGNRVLIGFAMEDQQHQANAERKLRAKQCDAIVLNDINAVGVEQAQVEILRDDTGWSPRQAGDKARIAALVVDLVEELIAGGT